VTTKPRPSTGTFALGGRGTKWSSSPRESGMLRVGRDSGSVAVSMVQGHPGPGGADRNGQAKKGPGWSLDSPKFQLAAAPVGDVVA